MLTGSEIRTQFLKFFEKKGHKPVHSSSLVPQNDPTLLFTNAGMNQFKDVFLGLEKRDYNRATTSQKCVRAGGKHNDLENVGFTNRHHTFFEMLGNFSFGDYFKKDAIAYAWELLTSPEWFNIPKDKLYVTIFKGENGVERDSEAYDLWVAQQIPKDRIFEFGAKDNFWQMGDTGPCGPCSEIHYDMGVIASDQSHTDCAFGCDCGRYVEIWNLVFMQFDRDASGKLTPLPKPSIDTGMGLERVASVLLNLQDPSKISNYDTDLFTPLIKRAAELTGTSLKKELDKEAHTKSAASLRVIADHSRAATFLISDGVIPQNEGRGYVLRKIIRRAITHGRLLGQTKPFLNEMVFAVRDLMQDAYPELKESTERVSKAVLAEESRFIHTLVAGLQLFEQYVDRPVIDAQHALIDRLEKEKPDLKQGLTEAIRRLEGDKNALFSFVSEKFGSERASEFSQELKKAQSIPRQLSGEDAFMLYDTFGVPPDYIEDLCRDRGMPFHRDDFDKAMQAQRERARASWKGGSKQTVPSELRNLAQTVFEGYQQTRSSGSVIRGIFRPNSPLIRELDAGDEGEVILDHTPFYADSGGQVGDVGWLYDADGNVVVADVLGCVMPVQGVRFHKVRARQHLEVGDIVTAVVNADIRESTMRNHTATHLLHAGLREVLGKHVKQAGSLVAPNHLRFDFSHFTGVEDEELRDIEDIINKEVLRNLKVETITDVPIDEAISKYHAMALFGEKYGDKVRVVKIGDFSTELCGGTHTSATGEIGLIKILKEGSVSSGVRRIEAVTGEGSLHHFRKDHALEHLVASLSNKEHDSPAAALRGEIDRRDAEIKRLTRDLDQARMKSASSSAASATENIREIRGIKVLAHRVDNLERAQLRTLVDQLRDKLGSGVVVVGSSNDGSVALIAGVTKDLTSRVQAGKIVGAVAEKVGGKGGGRPDLAEAGGKNPAALDSALADVYKVVEALLQG
jgi:alanyl-tRNA synthetase